MAIHDDYPASKDLRHNPDVYEAIEVVCQLAGIEPAEVARTMGYQAGTYKRSMSGNPTVKMLKRTAWALGVQPYVFLMDPAALKECGSVLVRFDKDAPVFNTKGVLEARANSKTPYVRAKRGDPLDKEALAQQYPAQAIKSTEILDTRYHEWPDPLPPRHINPEMWERERAVLSAGLPSHLVMTDKAVEQRIPFTSYREREWSMEQLAQQGLICEKGQEG